MLTDQACIYLCKSENFKLLLSLDIGMNPQITSKSLEHLASTKHICSLSEIKVSGCLALDDKALKQFISDTIHSEQITIFEIDEIQFTLDFLHQINFAFQQNKAKYSRLKEIHIRVENASLFFKLNILDILGFNSKTLRFLVNEFKEIEVVKNLAAALIGSLIELDLCAGKIFVNNL